MIATPLQLAEHAREIARAFNVFLIEDPNIRYEDAVSIVLGLDIGLPDGPIGRVKAAICAPITEDTTYAVAMHEIGHRVTHLAELGELNRTRANSAADVNRLLNLEMESEIAAWDWARHYALDWTPAMEHVREWALQGYRDGHARLRESLTRRQPPPAPAERPRARTIPLSEFARKVNW